MNFDEKLLYLLVGFVVALVVMLVRSRAKPTAAQTGPKPVDAYTIAHSAGEFPNVLVTFQLDDRSVHGPFAFVPPYAHMLADELTIASIRAAPKRSGRPTLLEIVGDDPEELNITDDGVNGSGGSEHA
jgi:hypothetical protein